MTEKPRILGVILAGGRSTRMGGGDKCLLPLGTTTVLGHVITRLRPQVDDLILNANGDPQRFESFGLPVVADSIGGHAGPLAGVLAGLDWAADHGFDIVVTAAADTPFFPDNLVIALQSAIVAAERPLAMAMTPGGNDTLNRHPTFGWWPAELRGPLREALAGGTRKIVAFTEPHGCVKAIFHDRQPDPFFNVNTPEDLVQAQAYLAETPQ